MAKDPAFLFYYQDFLVGTEFMTAEEVGCYIRILCHMADKGRLSLKKITDVCRTYVFTESLKEKFIIDENGLYYNKRLELEVSKRKSFCESRRKSRTSNVRNTYVERMEDENENRNENKIKDVIKEKFIIPTSREIADYCIERGNMVDPEDFFNFYESKGWMIGKNKMKNWKAAVRTWEKGENTEQKKVSHGNSVLQKFGIQEKNK